MEDITNIIANTRRVKRMDRSPKTKESPSTKSPSQSIREESLNTVPSSPSKSIFTISSNRTHVVTPNKRGFNEIRIKQSRLDLLDNQFTSFPLAPPPESDKVKQSLKSAEINAQEVPSTPQSGVSEGDPIVLVEDYIQHKNLSRRKLSVADLKLSLESVNFNDDSTAEDNYLTKTRSILASTSNPIRPARSQKLQRHQIHLNHSPLRTSLLLTSAHIQEENGDTESSCTTSTDFTTALTSQTSYRSFQTHSIKAPSISTFGSGFNSIPTLKLSDNDQPSGVFSLSFSKSSLKYCIICETPLYDLSSLLTSQSNYNEFVCSNCTEKYEALSKLVEDFDESISGLNQIAEDIEDIEEALNQPGNKKQKITSDFSVTLRNKLESHLGNKSSSRTNVDSVSAQWFLLAKKKLRWRWRISGLVPKFLDKSENSKA